MENLVHYSNPAHAISLLSILNEQRLRGQLCDIVLVVGEQRYQDVIEENIGGIKEEHSSCSGVVEKTSKSKHSTAQQSN